MDPFLKEAVKLVGSNLITLVPSALEEASVCPVRKGNMS